MPASLLDEHDRDDWTALRVYSVDDAREIDRRCSDDYAIPSLLLMEHAAEQVAILAAEMLKSSRPHAAATIVSGPGKNGGDGLAAARHLAIAGHPVRVVLVAPRDRTAKDPDTRVYLDICERLGLPIATPPTDQHDLDAWAAREITEARPDVVLDAVFGTGLSRPPEGAPAAAIGAINRAASAARPARVIAIDIPSGLEAESGTVHPDCVNAHTTVTFLGPKPGFLKHAARRHLGRVRVRPIGAPPALLARYGSAITRADWDATSPASEPDTRPTAEPD